MELIVSEGGREVREGHVFETNHSNLLRFHLICCANNYHPLRCLNPTINLNLSATIDIVHHWSFCALLC